jgi:hypothetical protein
MARQERRLRRRLKLELGLIDRVKSGDHQASNRARPTPRRSAGRKTA